MSRRACVGCRDTTWLQTDDPEATYSRRPGQCEAWLGAGHPVHDPRRRVRNSSPCRPARWRRHRESHELDVVLVLEVSLHPVGDVAVLQLAGQACDADKPRGRARQSGRESPPDLKPHLPEVPFPSMTWTCRGPGTAR